jgi:hypothetical protein
VAHLLFILLGFAGSGFVPLPDEEDDRGFHFSTRSPIESYHRYLAGSHQHETPKGVERLVFRMPLTTAPCGVLSFGSQYVLPVPSPISAPGPVGVLGMVGAAAAAAA